MGVADDCEDRAADGDVGGGDADGYGLSPQLTHLPSTPLWLNFTYFVLPRA